MQKRVYGGVLCGALALVVCGASCYGSRCGPLAIPSDVPPPDPAAVPICGTDAGKWNGLPEYELLPRINAAFATRCADAGVTTSGNGFPCSAGGGPYFCQPYNGNYTLCSRAVDQLVGAILDGGDCSNPLPMLAAAPGCVPLVGGSCSEVLPDGG